MNDGGPAFPKTTNPDDVLGPQEGMSLRDYFASSYIASVASSDSYQTEGWAKRAATDAYHLADAMLKAREAK